MKESLRPGKNEGIFHCVQAFLLTHNAQIIWIKKHGFGAES